MSRSFWGFGGGGSRLKADAIVPPTGAFAAATTALTTTPVDSHQMSLQAGGRDHPAFTSDHSNHMGGAEVQMTDAPSAENATQPAAIVIPPTSSQIKGKLRVRIIGARNLAVASDQSDPYVVCSCSTSEHISRSANAGVGVPTSAGGIAIPSKSRPQPHQQKVHANAQKPANPANPTWKDEAIFDLSSFDNEVEVAIFDAGNNEIFLGHARIRPDFSTGRAIDNWYPLQQRIQPSANGVVTEHVSGEVRVAVVYERTSQQHYGPGDFEILRLIGKGTFGRVYQVRKKDTNRIYAMKVLSKRIIVQKKEIAHTIDERNILVRTSGAGSNFLVGLKFSFQTSSDLYLVTDYMSGGELFWHLQREGRFSEQRAKFYIAELILALEHLHDNDIVYRDLKPENILLDAQGHVALCDFGLSKANMNNGTTNTFCGTTEYLAPEVLLDDKGYTKMVDFWSLGVLIFEMCCGWSPFYAEDNQQMYKNIAFGKVRFPKDALSPEGRDFVKGLLNRNPKHRLGAQNDARELMAHPFFRDINWELLATKQVAPPYKPHVSGEDDTSNFDPEFTSASTSLMIRGQDIGTTPLSPGIQDKFKGFTFVDDTLLDEHFGRNKPQPSTSQLGTSYRAPPPKQVDGIELYDDKDIEVSQSFYDNGIKQHFQNHPAGRMEDLSERFEEDDDHMRLDEEEDRNNYDDFVDGQGFEI